MRDKMCLWLHCPLPLPPTPPPLSVSLSVPQSRYVHLVPRLSPETPP